MPKKGSSEGAPLLPFAVLDSWAVLPPPRPITEYCGRPISLISKPPYNENGTFHIQRFTAQNNQAYAIGSLDGNLTDQSGNTLTTFNSEPKWLTTRAATSSGTSLDVQGGPANLPLVQNGGYWNVAID